jgi:aspartyl-tRNA(Asn)/glutamyl-tRNA(Gln) amidotransferase subunit A
MQAMKVRRLISNDFDKVWKDGYDLLLTPVTLSAAPTYTDFIRLDNRTQTAVQDYCTQSANMAGKNRNSKGNCLFLNTFYYLKYLLNLNFTFPGVPALSLPIKINSDGLPLSLQLIGPKLSESKLLNTGKFIEDHVQFPHWS